MRFRILINIHGIPKISYDEHTKLVFLLVRTNFRGTFKYESERIHVKQYNYSHRPDRNESIDLFCSKKLNLNLG